MADENNDDNPINNAEHKFTVEVHNYVMDTIIESMNSRFSNNSQLLMDLAFLSPKQFTLHKHEFPRTTKTLSKKILKFTNNKTEDEIYNLIYNTSRRV